MGIELGGKIERADEWYMFIMIELRAFVEIGIFLGGGNGRLTALRAGLFVRR